MFKGLHIKVFWRVWKQLLGNCSNCLTQFEQVDVTEIARALISCVESSRQRYGTTVIIDTVHGANTAKIKSYRMNENPYYSVLSKVPTYRIRQVLNYLQLEEYLFVTSDDYAVVKLGVKAKEIDNKQIIMKLAKESSRETKEVKSKSKKSKAGILGKEQFTKNEESLFEKLRVLRTEIAREEKVPPYIVFSDKTLTHMCIVKPKSKQEMLKVSGVGEFKFEKYGERFLSCIEKFESNI